MHFPLLLHRDQRLLKGIPITQFTSVFQTLAFLFAVAFVLILLFPREALHEDITGQLRVSTVTASYLTNLLRVYPEDDGLRLLLVEQQIGLNEIDKAKHTMAPLLTSTNPIIQKELVWLNYEMIKQQTYALPDNSPLRKFYLKDLVTEITNIAPKTTNPDRLMLLARDALAANDPQEAYIIYMRLFKMPDVPRGSWLATAGKTALAVEQYQDSANFYLAGLFQAVDTEQRRTYLMAAVNSLLAGGMPMEAYDTAKRYYENAFTDKQMLLYMAKLANYAGHPEEAQLYLQELLWNPHNSKPFIRSKS